MRVHWDELPGRVRDAIEERIGGRVVEAVTQPGGFSPGLAARVCTSDGRRCFVKAVSEQANPDSPAMHRREARIVAALPASTPVPRLLWTYDDAGWVALEFEDVDGRHPGAPWTEADLARVVNALKKMAVDLTPSPIETEATASGAFERGINGWRMALERGEYRLDPWCLNHLARLADLESMAPSAAAWVDWVAMGPSVAMQGGPNPQALLDRFHVKDVSSAEIDAVLCSLAGYFVVRARTRAARTSYRACRSSCPGRGRACVAERAARLDLDEPVGTGFRAFPTFRANEFGGFRAE